MNTKIYNKISNKILPVVLGASILFTSCNKYLDTAPDNRTEINSVTKVAQLIASAYPQASYAAMLNSRVDYVTDKGVGQETNSNIYPFFWRDVPDQSQDTPEYFWSKCYASIAEVNHAIKAAEQLNEKDEVAPYIGEGLVVRSFSHFMLVSLYSKFYNPGGENTSAGVPYITEPETVVVQQYERGTVDNVWTKAEEDLVNGLKLLGSDAVYSVPRYHFTQKAAHAYAARFYLYKGDWAKVIEHANTVFPVAVLNPQTKNVDITNEANVYAVNNFQPWITTYAGVPSSEDIKAEYTKASNPSNLLLTEMPSRLSRYANTWRYGCSQSDVETTVKSKNATGATWGFRSYSSSSTHYYLPKFKELFVRTSINASSGTIYTIFPTFRNEEVLLNRAEAYAMLDNFDGALADLNVYCRHRNKSYVEKTHALTLDKLVKFYVNTVKDPENFFVKYNAYNSSTWSDEKKSLFLFILDCRRNEFMWEGLRYWDLVRYKIPVTHKSFAGDENTLFPGDDRWVLQIPETAKLSGLELNPRTNLLSREW